MTTVKRMLRITAVLALTAAVLMCVPSCKKDSENDTLSQLEALKSVSVLDEVSLYRVIIPSSASSELAKTARTLALAITERSGVDCVVFYDNEDIPEKEDSFDILVGNTDRLETVEALDGFLREDYVCKMTDECLILGARSDSAAIAVVGRFIDEVLPLCEGTRIADYESDFEYRHDYEIDALTLCGFDFCDYEIVCTSAKGSAESAATYRLREMVADRCGAYPDVHIASNPKDGVKELVLGIDENRKDSVILSYDGEDVTVLAADSYGLSVGLERLYGHWFENVSDGRAGFDITYSMSYSYSLPKVDLVTVISNVPDGADVIASAMKLAQSVPTSADAVLFCGIDKSVWELVRSNLDSGFSAKTAELDENTVVAFAYKSAVLTCTELSLEDIGGVRVIGAELTFASDGQRFSVYSFVEENVEKRNDGAEALKNRITDCENPALAVYLCGDDSALDIIGEGITACQNLSVTVGEHRSRVGLFVSDAHLGCEWKGSAEGENSCLLSMRAQKRFCDGFLALG